MEVSPWRALTRFDKCILLFIHDVEMEVSPWRALTHHDQVIIFGNQMPG